MADIESLSANVKKRFENVLQNAMVLYGELTIEIHAEHLLEVCLALRDEPEFDFKLLADVCGVDYLHFGHDEWETEESTATGFERGVIRNHLPEFTEIEKGKIDKIHKAERAAIAKHRFASVYHLLSFSNNQRIRIRVFLDNADLKVPTVTEIWPSANWFEREAFDLFGIIYVGHPDLRRLLTDYGFVGHPFRKDFPLIGNIEARYDAVEKRVVYEPVSIKPRILEPKVIRSDARYKVGD